MELDEADSCARIGRFPNINGGFQQHRPKAAGRQGRRGHAVSHRRSWSRSSWDACTDVGDWLRSVGLSQYEATFRDHGIDVEVLPELTEVDFEKLGVLPGHRKRLLKAIRNEDMRQVIRAYQDACSGVVARYDGFVAKFMGDGVLAYFGFPRAHEDDAARAVHAGLEIAGVVGALETRARETLQARIGVATGLSRH
jgi:hypothetical protein